MTNSLPEVAAIVCAHNEAVTIGQVVNVLVGSGLFVDVIVVSDGSTDDTVSIAKQAGASHVLASRMKQGKGHAMFQGVKQTSAALIFFLDADLTGLTIDHLQTLLNAVRHRQADMAIGLRDRGRLLTALSAYFPLIGGERVLSRRIFEAIPQKFIQGYMAEIALNAYCYGHDLKIRPYPLKGLGIRRKIDKVGFWRGLVGYASMIQQVLQAMYWTRLARWKKEL